MRALRTAVMALAIGMAGVTAGHAETPVMGTGSAFAAPIYIKWAEQLKTTKGAAINYQPSGSSVGQLQVLKGLTDFGASDVPMEDSKLKEGDIMQFPTVVGGYAVVVNIPGVLPGKLRLTAPVLADIFMGGIKSWDDPQIVQLNPGLALPNLPISLLYHAGGFGRHLRDLPLSVEEQRSMARQDGDRHDAELAGRCRRQRQLRLGLDGADDARRHRLCRAVLRHRQ